MSSKIFTAVIFLVLFFFMSCKKKLRNDEKFIKSLSSNSNFDFPIINESLLIFVIKSDKLYITSLRQLYLMKEKEYKQFTDYNDFLIKVINDDFLSKEELECISEDIVQLDERIANDFEQRGIEYLKKNYCENSISKNKIYLKTDIDLKVKYSILYYFFRNNYHVMFNDYSGNYVLIYKG